MLAKLQLVKLKFVPILASVPLGLYVNALDALSFIWQSVTVNSSKEGTAVAIRNPNPLLEREQLLMILTSVTLAVLLKAIPDP